MKKNQIISLGLVAALLPLSACVTDPETGNRTISKAAIGGLGGALGGYLGRKLAAGDEVPIAPRRSLARVSAL